jgi:ABC-type transport system substrate-binding protein
MFSEVDRTIVKHQYDLNRAAALLADTGWRRASPGSLATNASGQTLDIELATTASQQQESTITIDNWRTAGVNSSLFVIPQARVRDGELRSSFAAAGSNGRTIGPDNFVWTQEEFPTPENRWIGSNRGSFFDSEIDRLQKLRVTSLDENERRRAQVEQAKRMSELVGPTPLIYSIEVILARKNVVGPVGNYGPQEGMTWNVHEWSTQ